MQKAFADWEKLSHPLPFCVTRAIGSCKLTWEMTAVVPEEYSLLWEAQMSTLTSEGSPCVWQIFC